MYKRHLTRKQLMKATGAMPYLISYLTETGRLPLIRPALGHGSPNLYHPDAIQVIRTYLERRNAPTEMVEEVNALEDESR